MAMADSKMLREDFEVFVDRLRDGHTTVIDENLDPSFLEIENCNKPVKVDGRAYLAGDNLIVQLDVTVEVSLPCLVCNENNEKRFVIKDLCLVEELGKITSKKYSFKQPLREVILLEMPRFTECNEGNCPQRKEMESFLNKSDKTSQGNNPFEDL